MAESLFERRYEEEFEFPLWKLIKRRAKEKDISYIAASDEVCAEYAKTIRYGDRKFEDEAINKRWEEIGQLSGDKANFLLAVEKVKRKGNMEIKETT